MADVNSTPRAAIYARVSTKDKGQDTEKQLVQLREFAAHTSSVGRRPNHGQPFRNPVKEGLPTIRAQSKESISIESDADGSCDF
jgi:hypothetical protein